jgi:hypothetical protein
LLVNDGKICQDWKTIWNLKKKMEWCSWKPSVSCFVWISAPGIMLLLKWSDIDLNDAYGTSLGSNPSWIYRARTKNNQKYSRIINNIIR